MYMEEWVATGFLIIAITACIKTGIMIARALNSTGTSSDSGNRAITFIGSTAGSSTETGPMVYYANNAHGYGDNEYHFNYKKVDGSWRAYILRMPSLGRRSTDGHATHRLWDGSSPYVCWDRPVNSLNDMQTISRVWADNIQEYIATGKRFG